MQLRDLIDIRDLHSGNTLVATCFFMDAFHNSNQGAYEAAMLEFLPKEVELNDDGTVGVNPLTLETNVPGVFAGGDAVTGPATVIEAICAGKRAAESIEKYLESVRR